MKAIKNPQLIMKFEFSLLHMYNIFPTFKGILVYALRDKQCWLDFHFNLHLKFSFSPCISIVYAKISFIIIFYFK